MQNPQDDINVNTDFQNELFKLLPAIHKKNLKFLLIILFYLIL